MTYQTTGSVITFIPNVKIILRILKLSRD